MPAKELKVTVLGAGIVGICCALELQRCGFQVVLIDRKEPGSETSSGNAGILSLGSIAPLASPSLLPRVPGLLTNHYADFKLHYPHLPRLLPWLFRFLLRCNRQDYFRDGAAINALTVASVQAHLELMHDSNCEYLAGRNGVLQLYRQQKSFDRNNLQISLFQQCGVETTHLNRADIQDLEPGLNPCFATGLWVKNSVWLKDPQALCRAYAKYFQTLGGVIRQVEVKTIRRKTDGWCLGTGDENLKVSKLVLCLGAWTPTLLEQLGYRNVIAAERGYHMMFATSGEKKLNRPIFDADGSYVMIPMATGLRVTTGSNLTAGEALPTPDQLKRVVPMAKQAFALGEPLLHQPWMGRRPSTPDSIPIIGPAPAHKNLWLAYAHAHMGLTLGPITGRIIADQIAEGEVDDDSPYSPLRYLRPVT